MTGSFKRGEGFDIRMYTHLHSIIRFKFQFNSNCDTDCFIYTWEQVYVWWHFEEYLCCYVFCFCLSLIIECKCLHEILGAVFISWVKVCVLGVLELRNNSFWCCIVNGIIVFSSWSSQT